jgi:hypothetical protein
MGRDSAVVRDEATASASQVPATFDDKCGALLSA